MPLKMKHSHVINKLGQKRTEKSGNIPSDSDLANDRLLPEVHCCLKNKSSYFL